MGYRELDAAVDGLELQEVTSEFEGFYDWSQTTVWWSPTAQRFFWYSDSGCSCYGFGDSFQSPADFSDGDREAVLRSLDLKPEHEAEVRDFVPEASS